MILPDMTTALCRQDPNPDQWFRENISRREARELCEGCPIAAACLAYVLENPAHGVWGGTTERMRADLRRSQKISDACPLRPTCKRGHDQSIIGATYTRTDAKGNTYELCAECRREADRARNRVGRTKAVAK